MLNLIRLFVGPIILFLDRLTSPKGIQRTLDVQKKIDLETKRLALYQFMTCPFCIKVRRAIKRLSLSVELRDAQLDEKFKHELIQQGGMYQTPCLRIEKEDGSVQWLYESDDIIQYLDNRFLSFPINS